MTAPRTLQSKLVTSIMLTSTLVLLLVGIVLIGYEYLTVRQWMVRAIATRGAILAANSTGALAFDNPDDARQVLSALKTDRSVEAAALYDSTGHLFATFPAVMDPGAVPDRPLAIGHRFGPTALEAAVEVREGDLRLGTLYLRYDLSSIGERIRVHALVVLLAILGSVAVAFILSNWLQRRITQPVMALIELAKRVSDRRDYSARAPVVSDDEMGVLGESINHMLGQIQRRENDLRLSEARMRAILESALDGIVTMDENGAISEFNPAAERLFGMSRASAIGRHFSELVPIRDRQDSEWQGVGRYVSDAEALRLGRRMELTAVRAGGETFPVEVAITRVAQDGAPMFTGFVRDITERKRAERAILQLNDDLEARVRSRTDELESFTYSVSHDLRAPLRAIDGFSEALLDEESALSDDGQHHLARVREAAKRMGELIDGLLQLARLSRSEPKLERVDLGAMAHDIAASLQQAQPERRTQWVIPIGLEVEGDAQLLRAVLDNLLRNAWKFTSRHPSARIELGCEIRDGRNVYFVRDDGAGFDMAHAGQLFKLFQRLHQQNEFEGTGIGLVTSHRIIQRHKGRLWAESAPEQGATFYFTLWDDAPKGIPVGVAG